LENLRIQGFSRLTTDHYLLSNTEKKMTTDGKYIYGFVSTNERQNLGPIGIDQREVSILPCQDIAAVVSDLPFIQFDTMPKETLFRNLVIYQAVIERVMKDRHIIPVKFGAMIEGEEEELKRILKNGYGQINENLKQMEGKLELNVAALWSNFEMVLKEIGEKEGIKKLKEEAISIPPDQVFEVKINVGKLVKESLDKKREECASLILDVLKKEAEGHRSYGVMDDSMILNVAFLINKDKQDVFEEKVDELDGYYQNKINFRIVGPLPPYSFTTLEIKKVEFAKLNEAKEMLGLGEESTPMEIKETYKELSKKFHPDKYPGDPEAQERFEKITKACQMLTEYCQEEQCSFKEADVREWIGIRPLEQPGIFAG
jgi:hypothetical protein